MTDRCANHPVRDAVAICASCGRALCETCWRRTVDRQPWCETCIHRLKSSGRNVAVAVLFVLLSTSAASILWRGEMTRHRVLGPLFWITYSALTVIGGVWFGTRKPGPVHARVEMRGAAAADDRQLAEVRKPVNTSIARSLNLVASPLSGQWTSTLLIACMVAVALAVPRLLHFQRWLEAEWVVLIWWSLWVTLLTFLLYRGWRISDDHVLALPQNLWADDETNHENHGTVGKLLRSGCDPTLGLGCGEVGAAAFIVGILFFVAWMVVELIVPCLFFLAYFLVRSSLARIANDRHGCELDQDLFLRRGQLLDQPRPRWLFGTCTLRRGYMRLGSALTIRI